MEEWKLSKAAGLPVAKEKAGWDTLTRAHVHAHLHTLTHKG